MKANQITITKELYTGLKNRYNKAVKNGEKEFPFEANLYLTDYAKYLLQYIEMTVPSAVKDWKFFEEESEVVV